MVVDVRDNKVEIVLTEVTPQFEELLATRYGADRITVAEGEAPIAVECTRRACGPYDEYWRAGLYIYGFSGGGWSCSSAFPAFRGGQGGVEGFLTAGHCGDFQEGVAHNGYWVGTITYLQDGGSVDAAWVDMDDNWAPTRRWVWELPDMTQYQIWYRAGSGGGSVWNTRMPVRLAPRATLWRDSEHEHVGVCWSTSLY
jgi:hypothetical protein